jgi:hypothetical protein
MDMEFKIRDHLDITVESHNKNKSQTKLNIKSWIE